jgi:thiamine pyrophosphate-dependent enzyme
VTLKAHGRKSPSEDLWLRWRLPFGPGGASKGDEVDRREIATERGIAEFGGFAMLMAEMTTAVQHNLPVKIIVLKNNSLAEVKFEQVG